MDSALLLPNIWKFLKVFARLLIMLEMLRKFSSALQQSSDIFGWDLNPLEICGSVCVIFKNLRNCSSDLRKSLEVFWMSSEVFEIYLFSAIFGIRPLSKYLGWLSAVFKFLHYDTNFRNLHINLHLYCNFHTCHTFLYSCYRKAVLLFSQSEFSKFFKCIINLVYHIIF